MKLLLLITSLSLIPALCAAHSAATSKASNSAPLARGRDLARLGDCRACHTQPGHDAFAGGRSIQTPFGVLYTPNITPDKATGIGTWSAQDFYRAMHQGIGPHGKYFYPAFPFPAYTKLRRADVNAIWAYLQHIKPVYRHNQPNTLGYPYSMRSSLWLWRLLYFNPGEFKAAPGRSHDWNRGAYLVRGLTHCGACHTPRNRWGAKDKSRALSGGTVAIDKWIAPNVTPNPRTGIGRWADDSLKNFLKSGRSNDGDALGPMSDVVQSSLQYLKDRDLNAIVTYLEDVPALHSKQAAASSKRAASTNEHDQLQGKALYRKHCASCHGKSGHAKHAAYPNLRSNSVVLEENPTNLILIMLRGGFQASTKADPYPYSMPPFGVRLSNSEIAAIATYVRHNWSRRAPAPVRSSEIDKLR